MYRPAAVSVGGSFPRRWQLTDWADLRLDGARGTQVSIGGRSLDEKSGSADIGGLTSGCGPAAEVTNPAREVIKGGRRDELRREYYQPRSFGGYSSDSTTVTPTRCRPFGPMTRGRHDSREHRANPIQKDH
jgi:hypothetical protein